jgi:ribosomal protein L40E
MAGTIRIMTDEQLRNFGYICEKCNATVPENARSRCGCDVEAAKRGEGWMLLFYSICEECYAKLGEQEQSRYIPDIK